MVYGIIRKNKSTPTRNYMYVHVKESSKVYRAPYVAGNTPEWSLIAYIDDVNEIVDDKIEDIFDPQPGTSANSIRAAKIPGYINNYTSIAYVDERIQGFRFGKDNSLFELIQYENSKFGYLMIHEDNISSIIGRDLDDGDLALGVNVTSDAKIALGKYGESLPTPVDAGVVAKIAYNYRVITLQIDGANQDANNPTLYLKSDGTTTSVASEARRMGYNPNKLELNKSFNGRDWGYSLMRGYIKQDKTFEVNSESSYYVMAVNYNTSLTIDKQHTAALTAGSIVIYNTPLDASLDDNPVARVDDVNEATQYAIEENNDEIITPNQGEQFQLIDADKSSGYGDNGEITYYGPNYSTGQAAVLINHLSNSKSYFIHKATGTSKGFAMLHESYVSQIYNKDVAGISELTMLFGPKSRGRYAKNNQVTPAGMVLNWNGEYLPDTEDPNDLNPSSWIDLDGNVTTEWSKTGIKTPCYSTGVMANDGSTTYDAATYFVMTMQELKHQHLLLIAILSFL